MTAPKTPRTAAATAAVVRRGDNTAATRLHGNGWLLIAPEHADAVRALITGADRREIEWQPVRERETVWCEAHGRAAHFEREDCLHPHFTDQTTRARMNAAARA